MSSIIYQPTTEIDNLNTKYHMKEFAPNTNGYVLSEHETAGPYTNAHNIPEIKNSYKIHNAINSTRTIRKAKIGIINAYHYLGLQSNLNTCFTYYKNTNPYSGTYSNIPIPDIDN